MIRGYNCSSMVPLTEAFTRDTIPANYNQIPTAELVAKWPHLTKVAQKMAWDENIPVGLLIGYHSSHSTFCPRETVQRDKGEPYAIRYDLGWVVMGDLQAPARDRNVLTLNTICNNSQNVTFACTAETSKQVNKLIDMLGQDFRDFANNKQGQSVEDKAFIRLMEKDTCIVDGHVTMPLPLKSKPPINNNSRKMAESRFSNLQKKLSKDENFSKQYHDFMNDLILKGKQKLSHKVK